MVGISADDAASAKLAESGISDADAAECGLFAVDDAKADVHPTMQSLPGLGFPYREKDGLTPMLGPDGAEFIRVRYFRPPPPKGFGKPKREAKYGQPTGSGVRAYFVPFVDWDTVFATRAPIIITEGEAKAIATCAAGFNCIGLGGVSNFMADGELIPDLAQFDWRKQDAVFIFDSDAATNGEIAAAEEKLARELSTRRGANVRRVRLPPAKDADGKDVKVGLDDYLLTHTPADLEALIGAAPSMSVMDKEVMRLNEDVAWISKERQVYTFKTNELITKDNFKEGESWSARKVIRAGKTKAATEKVSVAKEWLTHENARRYSELIFEPLEALREVPLPHGGLALNTWKGFHTMPGDISAFLELNNRLFSVLPADLRDFPLKLMAYKMQNPAEKVQIALFLVGAQGAGKGLWIGSMLRALSPYSRKIQSHDLVTDYNGYVENTLLVFVDEAHGPDMHKAAGRIKDMISNVDTSMNEKYRVSHTVKSYTMYVFSSNEIEAVQFGRDDRRMFVASVCAPDVGEDNQPTQKQQAWFADILAWTKSEESGPALADWLLKYDLKGWKPPMHAPMTHEKHMAYNESLGYVGTIAEMMWADPDENAIAMWIKAAMGHYAQVIGNANTDPSKRAQATEFTAYLKSFPIRPWYTADELALMFPLIAADKFGFTKSGATLSGIISAELRKHRIPSLMCSDNTKGFMYKGQRRHFICVMPKRDDLNTAMTQAEFDYQIRHFEGGK